MQLHQERLGFQGHRIHHQSAACGHMGAQCRKQRRIKTAANKHGLRRR